MKTSTCVAPIEDRHTRSGPGRVATRGCERVVLIMRGTGCRRASTGIITHKGKFLFRLGASLQCNFEHMNHLEEINIWVRTIYLLEQYTQKICGREQSFWGRRKNNCGQTMPPKKKVSSSLITHVRGLVLDKNRHDVNGPYLPEIPTCEFSTNIGFFFVPSRPLAQLYLRLWYSDSVTVSFSMYLIHL
jgi:hypothetical protein